MRAAARIRPCPCRLEQYAMTDQTATLELQRRHARRSAFPCSQGTIGPEVIDIRRSTRRPVASPTTPASCRRRRAPRRSRTSTATRASCSTAAIRSSSWPCSCDFLEVCYLLLKGELPNAEQKAEFVQTVTHAHDGARADEPVLPRLPARLASDGDAGRRRRLAVGVLSRLARHHRPVPSPRVGDPADRQAADAGGDVLQVHDRSAVRVSAQRARPTPRISCA